jgi:hypothetical protein
MNKEPFVKTPESTISEKEEELVAYFELQQIARDEQVTLFMVIHTI